jgi:putative hydrolase of the HAD superfamily
MTESRLIDPLAFPSAQVDRPPLSLDGIKAVLFDLDGTLRHNRPSFNRSVFDVASQFDIPDSRSQRRRALRWAHYYYASSPEVLEDIELFGSDRDGFMRNYVRRYLWAYGCDPECAQELAPAVYQQLQQELQQAHWVDPAAPGALETLQTKGFVLGVVSNRQTAFDQLLETLGLGLYFEFALAAGEVDSWKPDPGIFGQAMARAGSCPDCTMYVGDNYYADVVGAERAGVRPVLLDPEDLFPEVDCIVIRSLDEFRSVVA